MKITWLEKLAEEGHIRPEVLSMIYKDCQDTLENEKIANLGQHVKGALIMAAVGSGVMGAYSLAFDAIKDARVRAAIDLNKRKIVENPQFSPKEKEKAEARFNEIMKFAPHLGANEAAMAHLVHSRMDSGLSDRDVDNLIRMQLHLNPDPLGHSKMAEQVEGDVGGVLADLYIGIEKQAAQGPSALRSIGIHVLRTLTPVAIAGAGVAGAAYLKGKVDENLLRAKLYESYKRVMDSSEGTLLSEHPEKAKEAFQTLSHFAPHVAVEPNAARAFMTKLVSYGTGPNASDIKDLADIEKNMGLSSKGPLDQLGTAMSAVGMPGAISQTWKDVVSPYSQQLQADLGGHVASRARHRI